MPIRDENKARYPKAGDFVGMVVGLPGLDIDYALCIARNGDTATIILQVWQLPGPWHTSECNINSIWKTERMDVIGPALAAKRQELFPTAQETP